MLNELIAKYERLYNRHGAEEHEIILSALALAKAQAEGRIVELPCKVEDTLYWFDQCQDQIYESFVDEIGIRNGCFVIDSMDWREDDFGKTVFITREAAEKALGGEGK